MAKWLGCWICNPEILSLNPFILPLDGFVFGGLELNSSTLCKSQLVSLKQVFINCIVSPLSLLYVHFT